MAFASYTNRQGAPLPHGSVSGSVSPCTTPMLKPPPKTVNFELVFESNPEYKPRLPLRVGIYQHDSTESIVTTVKNFYGLYSSATVCKGVSFEDNQGNTLIARYENFRDNMVVYVRVFDEPALPPSNLPTGDYHSPVSNGENSNQQYSQHILRPTSRASRRRSPSPNITGRRSDSTGTKRSQASRSRGPGSQVGFDGHGDTVNGYTSGDGAPNSSSGKSKEQLGNTEISLENIVEGGRRKRAKFESSELPLFAPPQMPAATSNQSVSPVRRMEHHRQSMPFVHPNAQNPFTNPQPMQYNTGNGYGYHAAFTTPAPAHRHRHSMGYSSAATPGTGILPTPDPTIQSVMSEEDKDVAMQLMRLGDMSNVSQGRTSASTLDDTFSGRADADSSADATSEPECDDDDGEQPAARRQRLDMSGGYQKILPTTEGHFALDSAEASGDDDDYTDGHGSMAAPKHKGIKPRAGSSTGGGKARSQHGAVKTTKIPKTAKPKLKKAATVNGTVTVPGPMSPTSMPASRKQSVVSSAAMSATANGDDEPDLSTKPRCQRCRKSKKGCDRQRPCGRCKDAGIPADQCISEDEGNGRKGRYGRHMGVPVKIAEMAAPPSLLPAAPITMPNVAAAAADKNKKRKR